MLSEELIAKIGNAIDAIPPKPASRREIDLLITQLEARIRAAQKERESTCAEIAKVITDCGYPIKTSTLRVALQRRRKKEPAKLRRSGNSGATGPTAERASGSIDDQTGQRRQ